MRVLLSTPQVGHYSLLIGAETHLPSMPTRAEIPVIKPLNCIRTNGTVAFGSDHAIQLLVGEMAGLTQIDASAFQVQGLKGQEIRKLPSAKLFCYGHSSADYNLTVDLTEIHPSMEVTSNGLLNFREEGLCLDTDFEIEVRDVAIRSVQIEIPFVPVSEGVNEKPKEKSALVSSQETSKQVGNAPIAEIS